MKQNKIELSFMTTAMLLQILGEALQVKVEQPYIKDKYCKMMEQVSAAGVTAVEVTSLEIELFGLEFVQEILEQLDLKTAGFIHLDTFAETDPTKAQNIVEKAGNIIHQAEALGSRRFMLALLPQNGVETYSMEALQYALIQNTSKIAAYGKAREIKVSVEDTPEILLPLCSIVDIKVLLEAVPDLYLTYDSGNMLIMEEEPMNYLRTFENRISHIHLKDMQYVKEEEQGDFDVRGRKLHAALHGQGLIDFESIILLLRQSGYEGYAVIEYAGVRNHATNIKRATELFRGLLEK